MDLGNGHGAVSWLVHELDDIWRDLGEAAPAFGLASWVGFDWGLEFSRGDVGKAEAFVDLEERVARGFLKKEVDDALGGLLGAAEGGFWHYGWTDLDDPADDPTNK